MKNAVKVGIGLVLLGMLIGVSHYRSNRQQLSVDTASVTHGSLVDSTLASGNLVYQRQIKLTSELIGRVVNVAVHEGQQVKQGDLLLELDAVSYQLDHDKAAANVQMQQLQLAQAQIQLSRAEQQLLRQQQLVKRKLQSTDALDAIRTERDLAALQVQTAQAALTQAQATQAQAAELLRKSRFVAPMDGVVISVDVEPGETVIPGTTNLPGSDLLTLADTRALLAELRVDEADIAQISLGQAAAVYAAVAPEQAFHGKVVSIASSARQQGQSQALSFTVKVQLDQQDARLFPGMSCRAELTNQQLDRSLLIPASALQNSQVWRIVQGKAEPLAVTTGVTSDTQVQVLTGLNEGDVIIAGPGRVFHQLKAGMAVSSSTPASSAQDKPMESDDAKH